MLVEFEAETAEEARKFFNVPEDTPVTLVRRIVTSFNVNGKLLKSDRKMWRLEVP